MSESPYKHQDPLAVYCNPSGINRFDECETKWAISKLLGVERRKRASLDKGPALDARDRGKVLHKFIDVAVKRYAKTGEVWAFEGVEGKRASKDIFRYFSEEEGVDGDEYSERELLAAARYQIPRLRLERFEVVMLDGEPLVELDMRGVFDGLPMQAIVDCVLRHKETGELWVVDWKTTADQIDVRKTACFVLLDKQLELQRIVLEANGIKVDRAALVHVRSLSPQPPPLTKSTKKVTRDLKGVTCGAAEYRQALVDNGEDPDDPKLKPKYEELSRSVFSLWAPDITSPSQRAGLREQLFERARKMQAIARGEKLPSMLLSNVNGNLKYLRGCSKCDNREWCAAYLANGGQPDYALLGITYKLNDKGDPARLLPSSERRSPPTTDDLFADYCREYGDDQAHSMKPFEP